MSQSFSQISIADHLHANDIIQPPSIVQHKQVKSQNPRHQSESSNTHVYKAQLIKLISLVKLKDLSNDRKQVEKLLDKQIQKIQNIEDIELKNISQEATKITMSVTSILFEANSQPILPSTTSLQNRIAQNQVVEHQINRNPVLQIPSQNAMQEVAEGAEQGNIQPQLGVDMLCSICYQYTHNSCRQQCGHEFCSNCVRDYVKQMIISGSYFIKCPQYQCQCMLSQRIIKKLLDPKQFKRFKHFKQKTILQIDPSNKFCSRPDCGELLKKTKGSFKCIKCNIEYCDICIQQSHVGKQCNFALKQQLQMNYVQLQIKKCPKCTVPIQKNLGCNHIACKKCKFQFCWLCEKKYSRHHYRYYNCFGCPGMQFQNQDRLVGEKIKQILLFLFLPLILAILLFIYVFFVIIYSIGSISFKPCQWISKNKDFIQIQIMNKLCCGDIGFIGFVILWILLLPRGLIYMVFIGPVIVSIGFWGQVAKIFD